MTETRHDLVVIGAGPGGYIAAIRAAQLGLNVACIEKEPDLGGTCLRVGCIPSKALLESSHLYEETSHGLAAHGIGVSAVTLDLEAMMGRKRTVVGQLATGIRGLFKKHKITPYAGHGRLDGRAGDAWRVVVGDSALLAKHVILATGSEVSPLNGVEWDGDRIGGSTEALSYPEVPKHLVVIGAGIIGLELGSVWRRLGAKVTVLEYLPRILPGADADIAKRALTLFKRQGLQFELGVKVTSARVVDGRCVVEAAEGKGPWTADRVLLAVGRRPYTEGLGLDTAGISLDKRGRIPVSAHWQTVADGIFAIGDVVPGPMLAHKAEDEGVACAEFIATGHGHVNADVIPGVVYTYPEIAWVGKTEEELKEAGIPYRAGSFPFSANARAKAVATTDGLVKVLAHAETDRILGVHMLGPNVGELIAEAGAAMEFGASAEDVARTCHAHPTLSEVFKEACLAVDGRELNR